MTEELKPCPFCGGEAKSYFDTSCDCCGQISGVVCCTSCPAEVSHHNTEAEAITAWNTRPAPEMAAVVEALGDMIDLALRHGATNYVDGEERVKKARTALQSLRGQP